MNPWVILPYDGSPVARAALRQAARLVGSGERQHAGLIVATAGVDPTALDSMAAQARAVAGPDVPLVVYLLSPGDPIGALQELADSLPAATLAAPIGAQGYAPWYEAACRASDIAATMVLFFLTPRELQAAAAPRRTRTSGLLGALRQAMARLVPRRALQRTRDGR